MNGVMRIHAKSITVRFILVRISACFYDMSYLFTFDHHILITQYLNDDCQYHDDKSNNVRVPTDTVPPIMITLPSLKILLAPFQFHR